MLAAVRHQGASLPARTRGRRGPCRLCREQPDHGPCQAPHLRYHLDRARIAGLPGPGIHHQNRQRVVLRHKACGTDVLSPEHVLIYMQTPGHPENSKTKRGMAKSAPKDLSFLL
uniref:(northern house mosquito) hypothetical protein n=2 Tax=Culex pipiens TaxID=7175 RepID=A0A8D8AGG3_CULPI